MRPVSQEYEINQPFGSMATAGVVGNINRPDTVEYYVARYGNYQPYGHAGCDFACPEGTPVRAIADGTVLWADWGTKLPGDESEAGYRRRWYLYKTFPGIVTIIQHDGWIGVYAHLSEAPLNPGDRVTEGQVIARSGGTGGVAPHLHVEALVDLSYRTGGGLIYGRTSPEKYFGAINPQSTTTVQEDDMAVVPQEEWEGVKASIKALVDNVATKTDLSDQAKLTPGEVWAYRNPNIGGGDAYQILRDALASSDAAAAAVAKIAAREAASGATEEQIKQAVLDGLKQGVTVTVGGAK